MENGKWKKWCINVHFPCPIIPFSITMKKILDFKTDSAHYSADVCLAWCFDDRFTPVMHELLKQFGHADVVKSAGGAKALAGGESPERDFVFNQIAASIRLHAAKEIVLMVHVDCGAYGGSKAF